MSLILTSLGVIILPDAGAASAKNAGGKLLPLRTGGKGVARRCARNTRVLCKYEPYTPPENYVFRG